MSTSIEFPATTPGYRDLVQWATKSAALGAAREVFHLVR